MCLVQAHVYTRQMGLCDKAGCGRLTCAGWDLELWVQRTLGIGSQPRQESSGNGCSELSEQSQAFLVRTADQVSFFLRDGPQKEVIEENTCGIRRGMLFCLSSI